MVHKPDQLNNLLMSFHWECDYFTCVYQINEQLFIRITPTHVLNIALDKKNLVSNKNVNIFLISQRKHTRWYPLEAPQ